MESHTKRFRKAALGFRVHSGWAAMVAVGGSTEAPVVILRRRVELVNRETGGAAQPYHAAAEMSLKEASDFIQRTADATNKMADTALREVLESLAAREYQATACTVLLAAGRPLGDLASILASHAAIHTAEGEFFRKALQAAGEGSGLMVSGIRERDLFSKGTAMLRIPTAELERRVAEVGKILGPPWRQDEKLSFLAGWLSLAGVAA